ncbi:uncharacterized protein LOC120323895 [Pipra filicauda]|uniref:Uncharacterized protein LOC120323895 n=1 Tax=Pipra filicauda TaxID=649802 RepID=A0A7R5KJ85_9PASS|nr:uncharacterized protein LOC120323895 [Pipra filicauda]
MAAAPWARSSHSAPPRSRDQERRAETGRAETLVQPGLVGRNGLRPFQQGLKSEPHHSRAEYTFQDRSAKQFFKWLVNRKYGVQLRLSHCDVIQSFEEIIEVEDEAGHNTMCRLVRQHTPDHGLHLTDIALTDRVKLYVSDSALKYGVKNMFPAINLRPSILPEILWPTEFSSKHLDNREGGVWTWPACR